MRRILRLFLCQCLVAGLALPLTRGGAGNPRQDLRNGA